MFCAFLPPKPQNLIWASSYTAEQAARIREMTVITSSLMMSLTVDESDFSVHLVRKLNTNGTNGLATRLHGMTHRRLLVIYHTGFPFATGSF